VKILPSKTIRILRAARDMNTIMADPHPIRAITAEEYAGFHRSAITPVVPAALLASAAQPQASQVARHPSAATTRL
jgi:hypothetical protein